MTRNADNALVKPAFLTHPTFTSTLGPEVADLVSMVELTPDPEQRLCLDVIFALGAGRVKPACFEFCAVCARQNMKTALFKQCALGWLVLTNQRLITWSAHKFPTAQEAFRDLSVIFENYDFLRRLVKAIYRGNGEESIELRTGQRLIFRARTHTGSRGLTGDKVILDEAFALTPVHMGALIPTLSVRPEAQVVYGSSAGQITSEVLRSIRDRGRAGTSPRLGYAEWCAPVGGCRADPCSHLYGIPGCALDDRKNWKRANPIVGRPPRSNGTQLTYEFIEDERRVLPPQEFARERLGWWEDPGGGADAFGPGRWEACAGQERGLNVNVRALGFALSYDLTRVCIAAAGGNPVLHVKPLEHGPIDDEWPVARAVELQAQHKVPLAIDGKGPAAVYIPALKKALGAKLKVLTTDNVLDACAGLYDLVQQGNVKHSNYPELNEAVTSTVKRLVGDRWAWGRRVSASDISPLEAVTVAAWLATSTAPLDVWGFYS